MAVSVSTATDFFRQKPGVHPAGRQARSNPPYPSAGTQSAPAAKAKVHSRGRMMRSWLLLPTIFKLMLPFEIMKPRSVCICCSGTCDLSAQSATLTNYAVDSPQPREICIRTAAPPCQGCRRGVRFVELSCLTRGIGAGNGPIWTQHGDLERGHGAMASQVDQPIAALICDLKERGSAGLHPDCVGRRIRRSSFRAAMDATIIHGDSVSGRLEGV